eukprot:CAMPEP_0168620800 /NCGR_PEP_ID=MMETSP0449_2-20121227/7342_1 /TAXON_ID=1082188 /ORGANISM="Strombidium rassoulzadegani, Strain ras09" /LENGTH=34 /DNA_ID= /DNA_START= /DNA_END= /DNA_ORIENTATION=
MAKEMLLQLDQKHLKMREQVFLPCFRSKCGGLQE